MRGSGNLLAFLNLHTGISTLTISADAVASHGLAEIRSTCSLTFAIHPDCKHPNYKYFENSDKLPYLFRSSNQLSDTSPDHNYSHNSNNRIIRIAVTVGTTATVSGSSRAAVLRLAAGFLLYLAANDPGTDPVYLVTVRCCRISKDIAVVIKVEALRHSIIVRIDPCPSSLRTGTIIKLIPHSVRVGFPCSRK